ncbi:O-linked-mannose beta-1,4-N-acetylglucosaminyltransferase 2 [Paramuricea clavata]|uniref:O-linked-mannose beta-1,4-N-acetylglucosaminyltransferase 2 n=1 Tax=Paramuricea clavata TaxID=317549 RepID=A0A6S7ISV1_PARCT|nr:O-linked-mannose beta-1,4-N-acetylglucosaminyltransferase 2 [Paramuricea clavata]
MSWLFWYCIISHCIFTLILYKLTENVNNPAVKLRKDTNRDCLERKDHSIPQNRLNTLVQESSLWCDGVERSERLCKFRNLYYSPWLREFIFFHGESSVVQGVPDKRCSPALLDLSSINDHNLQYFNFQDAPVSALKYFSEIVHIDHPSLLFHRFNPENIMHVIHDDLLPLFYTLRQYFQDFKQQNKPFNMEVQIIFMEGREEGPYFELYKLFSNRKPILLTYLLSKSNKSLVCFRDVMVGISKSTTWYDYGFHIPQGPIPNHRPDGSIIQQFTEYVTNKLGTTSKSKDSNYVILFSRESNRLILNELQLTFSIATTFNLRVVRLSLETNRLGEIIKQIQGSVGIIGMHGSILVLSMFLSPGGFVIELFPYAINPQNYTPYKTLAEIMDITYTSWQNNIKNNTVVYPNRTKSEGGIMYLDSEMQTTILNTNEVPRHLCCNNPYWLFRIYQDTIVDIPTFMEVMKNALNGSKQAQKRDYVKKYPGKITNVLCKSLESETGVGIFVSWNISWNMQFYDQSKVSSEVWIQDVLDENYMAYSLQGITQHTFDEKIKYDTSYSVWVRGVINGNTGPFSHVCTCST